MAEDNRRENRKFHKVSRRRVGLYVAAAAFILVRTVLFVHDSKELSRRRELRPGLYRVGKVVDGFHFELVELDGSGGTHTLRLLGVCPMGDQHHGLTRRARDLSRHMAPEAGAVVLRLDRRRFDRDGVNLGHLYVAGRLLSCELLRAGLARLDTRPGDSAEISRLLSKAAEEAKRTHAGIWQERFTADSNSDPHHSDDRATFRGSR